MAMQKHGISIIIPAVKPLADCPIIPAFLESGIADSLDVQFVYMYNPKQVVRAPSERQQNETHEVLHVTTDLYFSSCEDNFYRVQDFSGLLKEHVFVIGEHDRIVWPQLVKALQRCNEQKLDVLGWNIHSKQKREDGSYSTAAGVFNPVLAGPAAEIVQALRDGEVTEGAIGFMSLLALFGPIDWASYIGSQLYSRGAFQRILMHKLQEQIYSFTFKQMLFCNQSGVRYGFMEEAVVWRVSDELLRMREGVHSWGWFEEHRRVHGHSNQFWIACMAYLLQFEDDALFHLIANCLCTSEVAGADDSSKSINCYTMVSHLFSWAIESLRFKFNSDSFYLPGQPSGSLQDAEYVRLFYRRMLKGYAALPDVYAPFSKEYRGLLEQALWSLDGYLEAPKANEPLLMLAVQQLTLARGMLTGEMMIAVHQNATVHYLTQKSQ